MFFWEGEEDVGEAVGCSRAAGWREVIVEEVDFQHVWESASAWTEVL